MFAASPALDARVLVLNRSFAPVGVASAARVFGLFFAGIVRALDKNYQQFDFESWSALSAEAGDDVVHTVKYALRVPRVVVLQAYDRLPRVRVRFSRQNVLLRDGMQCQYCGEQPGRSQLNLDHVIPRAQGGVSNWHNVVASCITCNTYKANRTPDQAGMKLLTVPKKPTWNDLSPARSAGVPYEEWKPFLDVASASYWHAELET